MTIALIAWLVLLILLWILLVVFLWAVIAGAERQERAEYERLSKLREKNDE